ncbi:MAG: M15 family metallopeptidase [Rhizobiales bacterium]|nr:M15 family metallopeptidase [Hyphomicrobiales bacterium]
MPQWPRDNEAALIAFYGEPGPQVERQLVKVVPPFVMRYDGKPIKHLLFHKKAAPALAAALEQIWQACGRDQARLDRDGVATTAGTYNPRKISGSNRWSNHAFGAALDLDAARNGFGKGKGTIPAYVIAAFDQVGFRWGGRYKGRTDPMHFEACDDGRPHPVAFADMLPMPDGDFEVYDGDAEVTARGNLIAFADIEGEHEDEAAIRDGGRDGADDRSRPTAGGFFGRARNWVTTALSSVGLGGLGALTNWEIAALVLGFVLVLGVLGFLTALWLFGKQKVADWVGRHLA